MSRLTIFVLLWVQSANAIGNSLADCNKVAAKFNNTCTDGVAADSVSSLAGANLTCDLNGGICVDNGVYDSDADTCTFTSKVCVTCSEDSDSNVWVRVQSNDLPRHCFNSNVEPKEQDIDFNVLFNVNVTDKYNNEVTTQDEVNALVCSIGAHANVPSWSEYSNNAATEILSGTGVKATATSLRVLFGIALDGMALLNPMSADDADPFYPSKYNTSAGKEKGSDSAERLDQCLEHPQIEGILHYHSMPPCMHNYSIDATATGGCNEKNGCEPKTRMLDGWSADDGLEIIGIAKDGHVVYGPYTKNGELWSGFDVCNGRFVGADQDYAYVATTTFPYYSGAFGPCNYPSYTPQCTTNGPDPYEESS